MVTISYKYNGDISDISVTQTNFAKFIGYSQQKVSNMLADGELVKDESDKTSRVMLAESLRSYYLSTKATGDGVNYWKEKALREQVNRKLDEVKLSKIKEEYYEAEKVESAFVTMLMILRQNLLAIPAKYAKMLENCTASEINSILTAEIEQDLKNLSEYDFSDMK